MNSQIERTLEAESASDSRGFFTDRPIKQLLVLQNGDGADQGPAMWARVPKPDVAVAPRASVGELLDLARSQAR